MGSPEYFAGSVVAQPLDETLMGPDSAEFGGNSPLPLDYEPLSAI